MVEGSGRVVRWKHTLYDWLKVTKVELAVVAELLLRGSQTEGDLRARASRMEPLPDLAALQAVLESLAAKDLVVYLTPAGRPPGGGRHPQPLPAQRAGTRAGPRTPTPPRRTTSPSARPGPRAARGRLRPLPPTSRRDPGRPRRPPRDQVRVLSDEVRELKSAPRGLTRSPSSESHPGKGPAPMDIARTSARATPPPPELAARPVPDRLPDRRRRPGAPAEPDRPRRLRRLGARRPSPGIPPSWRSPTTSPGSRTSPPPPTPRPATSAWSPPASRPAPARTTATGPRPRACRSSRRPTTGSPPSGRSSPAPRTLRPASSPTTRSPATSSPWARPTGGSAT